MWVCGVQDCVLAFMVCVTVCSQVACMDGLISQLDAIIKHARCGFQANDSADLQCDEFTFPIPVTL